MGRLSTLIRAKISKLLDRAEKPGETLDYAYEKQLEQIQVIRKGIVDVVAAKKRLQTQQTTLEKQVQKLDIQARTAIRVGRDDLGRMAIERKQLIIVESGSLAQQIAELEHQQEQMIASASQLRAKIEAFRSRKEVIKAQYSAAEAQVRISEAVHGIGSDMADVGLAMQRAIDKTETMRARANAVRSSRPPARSRISRRSVRHRTTSTARWRSSVRATPSTRTWRGLRQSWVRRRHHLRSRVRRMARLEA